MRMLKKANWPHRVTRDQQDHSEEVESWLMTYIGSFRDQWNVVYYHDHTDYYFKEGKHTTMFILRWINND